MMRALLYSFFATTAFSLAEEGGLSISLISENRTVVAGQPFTVGVHLKHDSGFHTYWKNPGIVGVATTLTWDLPHGFTASEIRWPYPEACLMAGHPCYGYEREVTLLVTITPPEVIAASEVDLRCRAQWMCCAKTCNPGNTLLSLTLPVAKENLADHGARKKIGKAEAELPITSPAWSARVITSAGEESIVLELATVSSEPPGQIFSCDGQVSSDTPQKMEKSGDGRWKVTLKRSELSAGTVDRLPLVLSVGEHHYSLSPRYENGGGLE